MVGHAAGLFLLTHQNIETGRAAPADFGQTVAVSAGCAIAGNLINGGSFFVGVKKSVGNAGRNLIRRHPSTTEVGIMI